MTDSVMGRVMGRVVGPGRYAPRRMGGLGRYCLLRARYVVVTSLDAVVRRWQLCLLAGLMVPGLHVVTLILIPVRQFAAGLSPGRDMRHGCATMLAVELVAILWLAPARRVLHGGRLRDTVATLPVSMTARCLVSGLMLLVLDIVIVLPLAAGAILAMRAAPGRAAQDIAGTLAVMGAVLCLQLGVLEGLWPIAAGGMLAALPLACALGAREGMLAWPMLAMALAVLAAGFALAARPAWTMRGRSGIARGRTGAGAPRSGRLLRHLAPVLRVQVRALAEHRARAGGYAAAMIALPAGWQALGRAFDHDGRTPVAAVIGLTLLIPVWVSIYETLAMAHARAGHLAWVLPSPKTFWARRDRRLVLGLSALPLLGFVVPLSTCRLVPPTVSGLLGASYLALVASLQKIRAVDRRWRLMVEVALCLVWSGCAMAGVSR